MDHPEEPSFIMPSANLYLPPIFLIMAVVLSDPLTGALSSPRKTVQYDPAKSETYKALQDQELGPGVHEVTPIEHRVFTPSKVTLTEYK